MTFRTPFAYLRPVSMLTVRKFDRSVEIRQIIENEQVRTFFFPVLGSHLPIMPGAGLQAGIFHGGLGADMAIAAGRHHRLRLIEDVSVCCLRRTIRAQNKYQDNRRYVP